mmetsp:Transcript_8641/g.18152  ORF Transcript_8641/g.18152 Transcript_8641/m.18152 type:complete len:749 (-) Transcript_8641:74-2320(-)
MTNKERVDMYPLFPLHPVLRLIHCLQRERGASCAMTGFRTNPTTEAAVDCSNSVEGASRHPYSRNVQSARVATNTAIFSFYKRCFGSTATDCADIGRRLIEIRKMTEGTMNESKLETDIDMSDQMYYFHQVLSEYNSFLADIIQKYVVDTFVERTKHIATLSKAVCSSFTRRETALSLLNFLLSFVRLKESLGIERAILSGIMAIGSITSSKVDIDDSARTESNMPRLPIIVNDLVMVVENQRHIIRGLEKQAALNVHSWSASDTSEAVAIDENYCSLLRLVGESIKLSDEMHILQNRIRQDFDVNGFQQVMTMEEFWTRITLYMDRLHSMEMLLLEELEQCECLDGIDQYSLDQVNDSNGSVRDLLNGFDLSVLEAPQPQKNVIPIQNNNNKDSGNYVDPYSEEVPAQPDERSQYQLDDWEISLYDVEFLKRIGHGAAGTTYLGKLHGQRVAVKVASISDIGVEGWRTELTSLKRIHHTNIIRFLGAIYNPSPLIYCLVLEYCNGGDLSQVLKTRTPPNFFKTVAYDVASGLAYLHKKNILHRDVKPGNVLLHGDIQSGNFIAKLTDFGLAAIVQNNSSQARGDELSAETGTYRYMAPEVIRHERYQYSADVYSFAILMWVLLTREVPFKDLGQIEAAGRVALDHARPPFPEGTPAKVKYLVENCWVDDPEKRMNIDKIVLILEELVLSSDETNWLQGPLGHPVYRVTAEEKSQEDMKTALNNEKEAKKRGSFLKMKSGIFRKRSSS